MCIFVYIVAYSAYAYLLGKPYNFIGFSKTMLIHTAYLVITTSFWGNLHHFCGEDFLNWTCKL